MTEKTEEVGGKGGLLSLDPVEFLIKTLLAAFPVFFTFVVSFSYEISFAWEHGIDWKFLKIDPTNVVSLVAIAYVLLSIGLSVAMMAYEIIAKVVAYMMTIPIAFLFVVLLLSNIFWLQICAFFFLASFALATILQHFFRDDSKKSSSETNWNEALRKPWLLWAVFFVFTIYLPYSIAIDEIRSGSSSYCEDSSDHRWLLLRKYEDIVIFRQLHDVDGGMHIYTGSNEVLLVRDLAGAPCDSFLRVESLIVTDSPTEMPATP